MHDHFLALANDSTDIFWLLTPTGDMQRMYSSWCAFTDQKKRQCRGRGWLEAVYPADRSLLETLWPQFRDAKNPGEIECRLRQSDGFYSLLRLRVIPIRHRNGSVYEILICGNILPEQKLLAWTQDRQLAIALSNTSIGLWEMDLVAQKLVWTPQQNKLFGKPQDTTASPGHFIGMLHPDDRDRIQSEIEHAMTRQVTYNTEYRVIWPDGSVHWLAMRGETIVDEQQRPLRMVGVNFDITRLKEAEERLLTANQQIKVMVESISDAFMHLDAQWRYLYVNQKMGEILGRDPEELPGQPFWETAPDFPGTSFEHQYREAMRTQQVAHFEEFHPTLQKWLEVYAYPTGEGLTIYLHDITARKQIEKALQESEARFRALMESNLIGITIADQQGIIYEANDAFLSLVEYTQEEVAAGRVCWTDLTPLEYQERDVRALEELQTTGVARPFEKEYITKSGKRIPVLIGGTILPQEESLPLILAFMLDLTAPKESDRQKDLLLAMTSHELKTPLSALRGTLQLVQRRIKRKFPVIPLGLAEIRAFFDDVQRYLATCMQQIDVQTNLINDLLDISRITANTLRLELDECDLVELVRKTVGDLRVLAPDRQLALDLPEFSSVRVFADRDRLSQVITNYVTNAIRYSEPGQPILVGLTLQEERARVWVRDRGPGLSWEVQRQIWQRFHQGKQGPMQPGLGKGLGLGLSICQALIAQHQGEVGVQSAPGEGSTFWFALSLFKGRGSQKISEGHR